MLDDLEEEARRRAETQVVIPAGGRKYAQARQFGRRWIWVQIAATLLVLLVAVVSLFQGYIFSALMQIPGLAFCLAGLWFTHRVHYKAEPPSLVLTPEGLYTTSLPAFGPIPWDEIEEIYAKPYLSSPMVRLKIRDMRSLRSRLSPHDRKRLWMFRLPGKTLGINGVPFGNQPDVVAQRLRRYWLYGPAHSDSPIERIAATRATGTDNATASDAATVAPLEAPTTTVSASAAAPVQTVGRVWWRDQ